MESLARIKVRGVVQGVGFRPFVFRLATSFSLRGWVLNSPEGVIIEVEGEKKKIEEFYQALSRFSPPLSRIKGKRISFYPPRGYRSFFIRESERGGKKEVLISPDISLCKDCLKELFTPGDRRWFYPFLNCTNCGPRFTIIFDLPYDREKTTMREFKMCEECQFEYKSPLSRRYHAEPNSCPRCGPSLWLEDREGKKIGKDPIKEAQRFLKEGKILGVKGVGGYLLTCDAENEEVVQKLRKRKRREAKPLALMAENVEKVEKFCWVNQTERKLLETLARPIVLLRKKEPSPLAKGIAPGLNWLGVMLPSTPLHYLLLHSPHILAIVSTSGNLKGEPMIISDGEAKEKLFSLADFLLIHNRKIWLRCDDSVIKPRGKKIFFFRRARGYAPFPLELKFELKKMVGVGAELKNTLCFTRGKYAFVSPYIGDLENLRTFGDYKKIFEHFQKIFEIEPEGVAYDMHPDYLSTRFALEEPFFSSLPRIPVQHHKAHLASCTAENGLEEKVIGVVWDGTGYGEDGRIWGGEFFVGDLRDFKRVGFFLPLPLPGGDKAVEEPWRMGVSLLWKTLGRKIQGLKIPLLKEIPSSKVELIIKMMEKKINSPLTSSAGRLFDAVSAILGVCLFSSYEAQGASQLQSLAEKGKRGRLYPFRIKENKYLVVDTLPLLEGVVEDLERGERREEIALGFHKTLGKIILEVAKRLREREGINNVCLSGGVFQNTLLSGSTVFLLKKAGFRVYEHRLLSPNDENISLGQAVIGSFKLQ